jgi:tRNA(Ile)-lysidine synthase
MGPHPAVAAVRRAVRASLSDLEPGELALAACSGGADSLALAAALAFEATRAGLKAGGITVDHGLQPGSRSQAERVAEAMTRLGLDPVLSIAVTVGAGSGGDPRTPVGAGPGGDPRTPVGAGPGGDPRTPVGAGPGGDARTSVGAGPGGDPDTAWLGDPYPGPEAAARVARYAALDEAARTAGAAVILLGHTLDDQAETVLLGLARGSGARSLAGMAAESGRYRRPLLGLRRGQTRAACTALGLLPWNDPQNEDPRFTRVRVRRLMPALEDALGPGVPAALARTARLLRTDADALDALAAAEAERIGADGLGAGLDAAALQGLPAAVRLRILRTTAVAAGCPPGALSERNVQSLDQLVTGWHGQRWADLPGGVRCGRRYGRLLFTRTDDPGSVPKARRGSAVPRTENPSGRK